MVRFNLRFLVSLDSFKKEQKFESFSGQAAIAADNRGAGANNAAGEMRRSAVVKGMHRRRGRLERRWMG